MDSEDIATTFLQNLAALIEEKKIHEIKKVMKALAKIDTKSVQYFVNRSIFRHQVIQPSLFQRAIELNFLEGVKLLLSYGGDFNR